MLRDSPQRGNRCSNKDEEQTTAPEWLEAVTHKQKIVNTITSLVLYLQCHALTPALERNANSKCAGGRRGYELQRRRDKMPGRSSRETSEPTSIHLEPLPLPPPTLVNWHRHQQEQRRRRDQRNEKRRCRRWEEEREQNTRISPSTSVASPGTLQSRGSFRKLQQLQLEQEQFELLDFSKASAAAAAAASAGSATAANTDANAAPRTFWHRGEQLSRCRNQRRCRGHRRRRHGVAFPPRLKLTSDVKDACQ